MAGGVGGGMLVIRSGSSSDESADMACTYGQGFSWVRRPDLGGVSCYAQGPRTAHIHAQVCMDDLILPASNGMVSQVSV